MTIDVIIDDDTLTVIHFHGKAVNPILTNQHFQYFEFKLLEFSISVRCLTQSNDFYNTALLQCYKEGRDNMEQHTSMLLGKQHEPN